MSIAKGQTLFSNNLFSYMVNLLLHNYGELWAKNNLFPCSGLTLRHRLSLIFQIKNRKELFKSEKPIDIGQALTSKFFSDS